jgi:hypothetical protein
MFFIKKLRMFNKDFKCFSGVFASVSDAHFKCFLCLQTYDANIVFGCFKIDVMLHLSPHFLLPRLSIFSCFRHQARHPPFPRPILDGRIFIFNPFLFNILIIIAPEIFFADLTLLVAGATK